MRFVVEGWFVKKGRKFKFRKEVEARSDKLALEKVLSLIGSNHKVKRRHIHVQRIQEA